MFEFLQSSIKRVIPFLIALLMPVICSDQIFAGGTSPLIQSDPPFSGTIFIDPDIITSSDPTTFQSLTYTGQASRTMFDRRVNDWITVDAFLFDASFDDGLSAEVQVNPEFGSSDAALVEAEKYATVIGRLPTVLRSDVKTVWIHKGVQPFGGGNNNLLIHTGQGDLYEADGILEETFVHEAAHTSLDAAHASSAGWRAAQSADGEFISTYARDNPDREDIAESFLPYLAVRYRSDRIAQPLATTILQTIPGRIAYFDALSLNMYPIEPTVGVIESESDRASDVVALLQNYPNPVDRVTTIRFDLRQPGRIRLTIVSLLGREEQVLISGEYPAGRFQTTWDATGFPCGLYFYRLEAGGTSMTRKLTVQP